MTANAWQIFDVFYEKLGNELHDLNATDTIKMGLILSGWTPNTETDVSYSVIAGSYEHAAAFGYTAGGDAVAATWDAAANTLTFDVAENIWTANGGSILARYALLYNSSAGGTNDLIAYCLMDNSPADVEATDGNTLTVTPLSGVFTISQV